MAEPGVATKAPESDAPDTQDASASASDPAPAMAEPNIIPGDTRAQEGPTMGVGDLLLLILL